MHSACQSYGYPTTLAHHSSQSFSIAHIRCLWLCALFSLWKKFLPSYSYPAVAVTLSRLGISSRETRHRTGFNEGRTGAPSGVHCTPCRPDEDVGGDGGRKWSVIFCLTIAAAQQRCICAQHGCRPPSVISGGARAGHDRSNDTVVLDMRE